MLNLGFVGLGVMGRPMASNLVRAGYSVTVHSRSPGPVDELVQRGATRALTPAAVASASEVLLVMVPTSKDFKDCLRGSDGILARMRQDTIIVDMGTHEPAAMNELSDEIQSAGGRFLDAPVSGGELSATDATLSIMVGGPRREFEKVREILQALASTVTYVGGTGSGQVAKACNQLVVGSTIQAVAEAITLASRAGADPVKVREAMLGGFARSRVLEEHGQRMLDRRFAPGGRAELHAKDAGIVLDLARSLGVETPGFAPVAAQLDLLVAAGGGGLDHSALITLIDGNKPDQ